MKRIFKKNRILAVLALLGLLVALVPLANRVQAEENNKYYDFILDYTSVRALAKQSSMTEGEWLDVFASLGVDKVALNEASAINLNQNSAIPVHAMTVSTVVSSFGWETGYPEEVAAWLRNSTDMNDAIVCTESREDYEWILNAFQERFDDFEAKTYLDGERGFIFIQQQKNGLKGDRLLHLRLGIWPEMVELLETHGYQIIPRTVTMEDLNGDTFAKAFIDVLEYYDPPYFINNGDELVGSESEDGLALLRDYLNESGTLIGMFEQSDQSQNDIWPDTEELLDDTDWKGVRIFYEWSYIQNRYEYCGYEGPEEITNTFFRAIVERNCKVIFLRMMLDPDSNMSAGEDEWIYITDPAEYEKLIGDLDTRLEALGYTRGTVPAMTLDEPSLILQMVQGIGTVALIVLLLDVLFDVEKRWRDILLGIGSLGMVGLAVISASYYRLILSMAGGIVVPALVAVQLCRTLAEKRKREPQIAFGKLLGDTMRTTLGAIAATFLGALLASSALSQLSYMLEIDLYRGVKLMQLIPIGVFAFAYLLVFAYEETGLRDIVISHIGQRGEKGRMKRLVVYGSELMKTPMQLGWFLGAIVIGIVALLLKYVFSYYIARIGNSVLTADVELQFRNFLENLLIARPRTKEMLIGWPMLMIFIWSIRRGMRFLPMVFGLAMSIGLVSVVNTFLHIRTPFLLSVLRTFWGVLFGVVVGVMAVLVLELLYRTVRKRVGGKNV